MLTSPSNHVCKELDLWKLVLEKYFLDVEYYVLRALGGDPYLQYTLPGRTVNRLFVSKNENKTVVQELVQEFLASSPLAVLLQRGSPVLLE